MFKGFPFLEKLFDHFHTLACGFCQQEVYVVKISDDSCKSCRSQMVKTSNEMVKIAKNMDKIAQIFFLKKN